MNKNIIKKIVDGELIANIGKYIKDGKDHSWDISVDMYNEYTGEKENKVYKFAVLLNALEMVISSLSNELKMFQDFKTILQNEKIPIVDDLTETPEEIE